MKKIVIIGLIYLLTSVLAEAQSIKIVRTDVDSSRKNIVTATYLFGFDIYADDVDDCNGVAFELRYNQTEYVKFSGWQNGDFGEYGNAQVVQGKTQDNKGRIIVGTGTGIPLGNLGIDNPKVIHLEFAVTQSAPHFSFITFEFLSPKATVFVDSLGQKIDLDSDSETFRIHSFIDVWPGDANNDGSVTFDDFNQVNLYMGMGSATKNLRSFKRPQASTIWKAQRVLAWDSADVTYADCDGNGDITSTDHLIVTYNIDKTQNSGGIIKQTPYFAEKEFPADAIAIPVYANSDYSYIGASGEFMINVDKENYLGVKSGELFKTPYIFDRYNDVTGLLTVTTGNIDKLPTDDSGVLFYIMLKKNTPQIHPDKIDFKAITNSGYIFDLNSLTSIITDDSDDIFINDNSLILPKDHNNSTVQISDIYGNILLKEKYNGVIDLSNNPSGVYFLRIISDKKLITKKIVLTK